MVRLGSLRPESTGEAVVNPIYHLAALAIALAAYVVLTVTGHDGNPVFVFMGGQGAGLITQLVTESRSSNNTPSVTPAPNRSTIQ